MRTALPSVAWREGTVPDDCVFLGLELQAMPRVEVISTSWWNSLLTGICGPYRLEARPGRPTGLPGRRGNSGIPQPVSQKEYSQASAAPAKDECIYLRHILDAISRIEAYSPGGRREFFRNTMIQDAVIRNLEVIGEATRHLTIEITGRYPGVPWRKITSL